ncbi:amino acid-binding protein [Nocardia mangyaensis]|uniref:Amino acid-binding protein n=1 Tax=Nocardia mangyaensis TaxID=2213200 RepID=A0A1J0VWS3_9NOCA|nr:amino acid-binding protein [Nocardia mangyaensis]APE36465.1 amino acid-binding protein [Nocardia mangyaensis]
MWRFAVRPRVTTLACEVCGRLPHPRRTRLALAKLAAVFPVELALHALVIHLHPPYLVTVVVLTVTTTILVIWVVEPSAMRMLGGWLHGPELRHRDRIDAAPTLWRIRVRLADRPGALETLAAQLAHREANILTVHVHQLEDAVLDELVVSAPAEITAHGITAAVVQAGGSGVRVWPATVLSLIDGQTKALAIAARIVGDPDELPLAVAELLGARYLAPGTPAAIDPGEGTVLELDRDERHWGFVRPDEPFTPAEIARAHRLADLAAMTARRR